ncbi:hypothetical protein ACWCPS_31500 [Streptomyces mauvecolor]
MLQPEQYGGEGLADLVAPGIETLRLEALNEQASVQLLARNGNVPPLVGIRPVSLTMGGPLALLERAAELTGEPVL